MALMFTNSTGTLQGILRDISFDADIGDGNDFLLTVPKRDFSLLGKGCRVFDSESPSFGGMVDGVEVNTESDTVSFTGATWQGLLSRKVICPPQGEAYKTITGSTIYIMGKLVDGLGFDSLFYVPGYNPDTPGEGGAYQFNRYVTLLDGLTDLLKNRGGLVLSAEYDASAKKVKLTAQLQRDLTDAQSFIRSSFNYRIGKQFHPINHMICLGKGELTERTVIDLYLHADGTISYTQQYSGADEVTYVYENTSAETPEELERFARKKFAELIRPSIEVFVSQGTNYRIGDIIGGYEPKTKTMATATITSLILQINGNIKTISYKTQG